MVVKQPMTNEAKRHLQNMQNKQKDYGSWSSLGVKAKGDAVVTPFLQEKSLGQQAKQAIYEHNVEKVKNLISTVSMLCEKESAATGNRHIVSREMSGRERTEFAQVFGTSQICPELPCIAPANIDLILDNIFEKDGKYRIDKISDVRYAASLKAGGAGIRYTCHILGKERYLFLEENRWFVDAKQ